MRRTILAGEVRWLNESVVDSGARLVVVFLPPRELVYPSASAWDAKMASESEAIVAALRAACSSIGVPFADVTAAMRAKAQPGAPPLYYHEFDGHPTPAGYRILAEAVADFLLKTGTVGPLPKAEPQMTYWREMP